jgi:cytidylate kinase
MKIPGIIAIDGPAASGKSTLGKKLAEELEYLYFDTGVMYRAVTWLALEKGVPIGDDAGVTALAENCVIDIRPPSLDDGRDNDVLVNGTEVTWEIRSPLVDANVSPVSAYPGVRAALTTQQRRIGMRGRVVMVGRDIGTVVLPEAELKIYLDASAEERARRRYEQQRKHGLEPDYDEILAAVRQRDQIDSTRDVAPLQAAPDAVVLDSNDLDALGVFEQVMDMIK